MLFGMGGLRRGLRQYFGDASGQPRKKIDDLLEAHRLELLSGSSITTKHGFFKAFIKLAKPYYWDQKNPKEKTMAWGLLLTSIALTYYQVTEVAVGFNGWNKQAGDFIQQSYNSAAQGTAAVDAAWNGFIGIMQNLALLTGKLVAVGYLNYKVAQEAAIRWRKWMTEDYEKRWLDNKAFYHMQYKDKPIDNPDQRIHEDPNMATGFIFNLTTDAFDAGLSLATFSAILWGLSGPQDVMGVEIPKFMFCLVMAYAALGTAITYYSSKPLEKRSQDQQMFEGTFRADLREAYDKAEAIALNNTEGVQAGILKRSFNDIYNNYKKIISINAYLKALRLVYHRLAGAVPLVVTFPEVVAGRMQVGGIFQVAGAFGEVKTAMSWYVDNAAGIRAGKAYMNRLIEMDDVLKELETQRLAFEKAADIKSNDDDDVDSVVPAHIIPKAGMGDSGSGLDLG